MEWNHFFIESLDYQRASTKTWTPKLKTSWIQHIESVQPVVAQIWLHFNKLHGNQQAEIGKTIHMTARFDLMLVWVKTLVPPCIPPVVVVVVVVFFQSSPLCEKGWDRFWSSQPCLEEIGQPSRAVQGCWGSSQLWISCRICGGQRLGFERAQHVFSWFCNVFKNVWWVFSCLRDLYKWFIVVLAFLHHQWDSFGGAIYPCCRLQNVS